MYFIIIYNPTNTIYQPIDGLILGQRNKRSTIVRIYYVSFFYDINNVINLPIKPHKLDCSLFKFILLAD